MQSYKKIGNMSRTLFAFLLAFAAATGTLRAQSVGVVMSGGGAKGLYHIGVLEALEENGIPVDYVAGTSMGSIIAAMYAAGYSPAEMRTIVASGVVREWVSGRIDPSYTAYYRQIGSKPAFMSLRLDLHGRKKLRMPTNLLSSTQIDMALTELFAPATAASAGDFDRLMVPFLCVASDMNARGPVVFRAGDLSEAVRASMSIPLVFKPMKVDSMLLYDGGIYDNFPWRPLDEEFRPDLIVGSICTEGNTPPREKNSLMDQAFMLAMHDTDYDLPEARGIAVRRAVEASMLDFDNAEAIIDSGYMDAMRAMPRLLERVSARRTPEEAAARREAFREKCPPLIFNDYKLEGLTDAQRAYIRDFTRVDRHYNGRQRKMGFGELKDNLYSVLAGGEFTMGFPRVTYDSLTERYSFAAHFDTRPNFRVQVGGNVSSTAFNQAYIGVNYQLIGRVAQSMGADLYLGPIYTWGALGGRTDFYMWKPLFLDYSYNFSVRNFRHGTFGNVTKVDNAMQVKSSESFFSMGFGMPLRRPHPAAQRRPCELSLRFGRAVRQRHRPYAVLVLRHEGRGGAQYARQVSLSAARLRADALGDLRRGAGQVRGLRPEALFVAPHARVAGRALYVEQVFRHARLLVVLVRVQRRCRRHQPSVVYDRHGVAHVDAGLSARAACQDALHARFLRPALRGGRRDADFRSDGQFLLPDRFLRDVPRETVVPALVLQCGGSVRRPDALHRRGVAGLSHAHRAGEPGAYEIRPAQPQESLSYVQLRLCDFRSARHVLLTRTVV